ncbi:hypothetical protein [Terrabacter sp. BE26]|uniref:hypothetical protein n=1 Tax=Terrabacter sp. BE26 TaxID=2898152 RepID=UPI0035BE3352
MATPHRHRRFTSLVTAALAAALAATPLIALGPSGGVAAAAQDSAVVTAPASTTADPSVLLFTAKPGGRSVALSWCCGTTPPRTYTIRRDTGTGTPSPDSGTLVYQGTALQTVDSGLEPWTTYRYTIWAEDGAGGFLAPKSIVTATKLPPVADVQAKMAGATSTTITWSAPTDPAVVGVVITRTDRQNVARHIYSGPGTTATDTGLVPGLEYTYTAHPMDVSGRLGQISGFVRVTTNRTWTTLPASPFVGWPGAMACATSTWCVAVHNTGAFQVLNGTTWSKPVQAFASAPDPSSTYEGLVSSLTCPAAGHCLAIRYGAVIELSGGTWRPTGSPIGGWTSLDCPTTSYCVAIRRDGTYTTRNGTTWRAPARIGSLRGVEWNDVACQAAARCFAVATGNATSSNWRGTLTSTGWSTAYFADYQAGNPRTIACSATSCLALGDRIRVTVSGTTWSFQTLPSSNSVDDYAQQLSCGSPTLCMSKNQGNVARWTSTTLLERRKLSAGIGDIRAVSCPRTGGACFAIDDRGRFYRWTSTAGWALVSTSVQTTGGVGRVGCRSTMACSFFDFNGFLVSWNGSSWTRSAKLFTQPAAVECSGAAFCLAVDGTNRSYRVWSGGSWGAAKTMPLSAVEFACSSPTLCLAIDEQGRLSRFAGTGWWAPVATITDRWGRGPELACSTGGPCMLLSHNSTYRQYAGSALTAIRRVPTTLPDDELLLLSCGSATSCLAVFDSGVVGQWNGSAWAFQGAQSEAYRLGSLACVNASHCLAGHGYSNDTWPVMWNSGVWTNDGTYPPEGHSRPVCLDLTTCFVGGVTTVSRSS